MENSTIDKTMTQATNFDAQEPILQDTQDRFVLFPIQYEEMWHMYKCANVFFRDQICGSISFSNLCYE